MIKCCYIETKKMLIKKSEINLVLTLIIIVTSIKFTNSLDGYLNCSDEISRNLYTESTPISDNFNHSAKLTDSKNLSHHVTDYRSSHHQGMIISLNMADLYLWLVHAFKYEMVFHKQIDNDKLVVLKNFVSLLVKYFPRDKHAYRFLKALNDWLSSEFYVIKIENFKLGVKQILCSHPIPIPEDWVTCKGSQPYLRGYQCATWLLFHSLTVNEYLANYKEPTMEHQTIRVIRDWVKHFFACGVCRQNFLKETFDLDEKLDSKSASVRLLWKVHNRFNEMLKRDYINQDPYFQKTLFPSRSVCWICWYYDNLDECHSTNWIIKQYRSDNWKPHQSLFA